MITSRPKRIAKKIVARALDLAGVEHSIWLDDKPIEYEIAKRTRPKDGLGSRIDLRRPAEVLFIADSAGRYAQVLHGILSWALWLRGVPNRHVICDGGLQCCDAKKITYPDVSCHDCSARTVGILDAFGLPCMKLSERIGPAEIANAYARVNQLSWDECNAFEYRGLALGEFALVSLLSYHLLGKMQRTPEQLEVFRRFLATAIVMVEFYTPIFAECPPRRLFLLNGLYLGWRVAFELARRHNVPVTVWEVGIQSNTIVMAEDRFAGYCEQPQLQQEYRDRELTSTERYEIETYLARRRGGDQGLIQYVVPDDQQNFWNELALPKGTQPFTLFTNVEWDSAVVARHTGFAGQIDWILATIEQFSRRPQDVLVVRVHPGEIRINKMESRDRITERVKEAFPQLPANVRVIGPEQKLNSYDLVAQSRAILVYTSTIGLEAACMGKPVIVAGKVHYASKGFTCDPCTPEDYRAALESLPIVDGYDSTWREKAVRYGHLFFIQMMLPHDNLFRSDHLFCVTGVTFRSLGDLAPGANKQIDTLCDIILKGRPPLVG